MKLFMLYRRRWWLFYLPVLLCSFAAMWWAINNWQVVPPMKVVMSGGSLHNSYARLAQRYAEQLDQMGISAEIVSADTEAAAMAQLVKPGSEVSVGFANTLFAHKTDAPQALAVIGQEPVWIFSSLNGPSTLSNAKGLRIAIGPDGSSTASAARLLLAHAGVKTSDVRLEPLAGTAAAEALLDGKVDMVFHVASEETVSIQLLTRSGGIQLVNLDKAASLSSQERPLGLLLLPQGVIELRGDIPPRDVTMVSLQTHLLVKPELHPALQRALLRAASDIHEVPTFLQRHGQFPSFRGNDFELSPVAKAYSHGAVPWMETLLPYGKAQWAELIFYALLPILAVTILVLTWIPRLFDWRINAGLNNFYGELKFLENEMIAVAVDNPIALKSLLQRLDEIEQKVVAMDLPDEYSERWYTLREHLAAARESLLKLRSR
ncbi:MAG: TAXI family TRAP transporter solute-binding subunit [Polaromonas sp.]